MIQRLRSVFSLNTMFSKLMASFLLIILTVSSIHLLSYKVYLNNISREIETNANERLSNVVHNFDQNFDQIQKILLKIYSDDSFIPVINNGSLSPYQEKVMIDTLKSFTADNVYIASLFLVMENSGYVVTPNGSYTRDRFFNTLTYSPMFTEDFWIGEMGKPFTYNYYPAHPFLDKSAISPQKERLLMPVVFKSKGNSRFILIALVDIQALANSIEPNFMYNLYISKDDGSLIYPMAANADLKKLLAESKDGFSKSDNGYIFTHRSPGNGFNYIKLLSDNYVKSQLDKTYLILLAVIAFAFVVSLLISIYIVRKFNNPVKSIVDIIQRSETAYSPEHIVDLKYVKNNIEKIVMQNSSYINDINRKDSMLKAFFYESKMKNIYVNAHEIKDHLANGSAFALVHLKVHFRQAFFDELSFDSSKGFFIIKELFQMYLKSYYTSFVLFQPESDQITVILDIDEEESHIKDVFEEILLKLKQEEDYLFFTVVISNVYHDVSELNQVNNTLLQMVKYRRLIPDTQVMLEASTNLKQGKFYFSLEQARQLSSTIMSGKGEEAAKQAVEILDYNFKRDVDAFNIFLLCTEFINCSTKVLSELYYEIPESFDTRQVYSRIEQCTTIEQCKSLCMDFIKSVTDYINTHKKENDYIVDYVDDYIKNHYAEDIYLDLLADKLNITKTYLSSYYKNKTGINLSDSINNYRIIKSLELLVNTTMKVQDIGALVGLSNSNTFIRLFKKYTGNSPGEYRKMKLDEVRSTGD